MQQNFRFSSCRPELLAIISKFQLVGPLIAEGYYDVDRSRLVSLTGTFLTYIKILVQMGEIK